VKEELNSILASSLFLRSAHKKSFLNYVVEKKLAGRPEEEFKEYTIATVALGKSTDFDPKQDNLVRREAAEIREKLQEYYNGPGKNASVRISIPTGTYVPVMELTSPAAVPVMELTSPAAQASPSRAAWIKRGWPWILALAVAVIIAVAWRINSKTQEAPGGSSKDEIRIVSPKPGSAVGTWEDVTVARPRPGLKCYLVVEPLAEDSRDEAYLQKESTVSSSQCTIHARFGETFTPSGTKFRIHAFLTKSDFQPGHFSGEPDDAESSPSIIVTKK